MNVDEKDDLIEVAIASHTPPGWSIQRIEIKPSGKAPTKYGPSTYRFSASLTLSVILPRRGWTLVRETKAYAYLIPPAGQQQPPFLISIAVPPPSECLALARSFYARRTSWRGQLGEWPALYTHERNTDVREMWRDTNTGEMMTRLHENPRQSALTIGEWRVWEANVTGEAGDFVLGILPRSQLPTQPIAPLETESRLVEGAASEVTLTRYERNEAARRRCIVHYGPECQACGLRYEAKYGAIGADLIHVHHVTPLSAIGESYDVDPVRDLIPLCATCHHVTHRRDPPYSVQELKAAIAEQATHPRARDTRAT